MGLGGCLANVWRDQLHPRFSRATITDAFSVPGESAKTVTLTGERLRQLLQYLPGAGTHHETGWGASGLTGMTIVLYRDDGRRDEVAVDMDMTTWTEWHGSHWLDPGFRAFIAEVFPPTTAAATKPSPQ